MSVLVDTLDVVEAYVAARYVPATPGPQPWVHPPNGWADVIENYLTFLVAAGQPATTVKLRRSQLGRMARELCNPTYTAVTEVTGDQLVNWMGSHKEWSRKYRRSFRFAARGFFLWAYRTRRLSEHIADELPKVRQA